MSVYISAEKAKELFLCFSFDGGACDAAVKIVLFHKVFGEEKAEWNAAVMIIT
jgi:hypothetical protein